MSTAGNFEIIARECVKTRNVAHGGKGPAVVGKILRGKSD